jgi:hypothetical protein
MSVSDTAKMRRPYFPALEDDHVSGRVKRDDRGNAVWEWKDDETLDAHLHHVGLAINDEEAAPGAPVRFNKAALRSGYDPYESGLIDRNAAPRPRKRNLRALSEWIALKKKLGEAPER